MTKREPTHSTLPAPFWQFAYELFVVALLKLREGLRHGIPPLVVFQIVVRQMLRACDAVLWAV